MKRGNVWRTDSGESTKPQNNSWSDENEQLKISATAAVGPGGFTKFGDIPAHQLGRALRSRLYKIANELPTEEHNNLSSRIKYAATTVTASLAAGFGERIFRSSVSRTLESRGALCAIQDHLEHLSDQQLMDQNLYAELKGEVDAVISAVNDYLGNLVKEQNRIRDKTPAD